MGDDLDAKPSGEAENENLITKPMVNMATHLIHKLAKRRGADYQEIQKKCKKLLGYTNLAKVSLKKGHAIINKLIELTGGEEEEDRPGVSQGSIKPTSNPSKKEELETAQEDDLVTGTMRKAIKAAVDITIKEVVDKNVPVQGLGGFVLEIGKVIFEAKMAEAD